MSIVTSACFQERGWAGDGRQALCLIKAAEPGVVGEAGGEAHIEWVTQRFPGAVDADSHPWDDGQTFGICCRKVWALANASMPT